MHDYPLLVDLLILLAVSLPVSFLFQKLRLPTIAGFLATGVLVGPFGAGLISGVAAVRSMAEIGVVLLLFTIGLEFSISRVFQSGKRLLLIGLGQVALTAAAAAIGFSWYGLPLAQGIGLGFLIALSSTAVVLKLLTDREEINTPYGRASITILLLQDLCVIPLMLLIPVLAGDGIDLLSIGKQLLLAIATIAVLVLATRYFFPLLIGQVLSLRNRDLFLVTILFVSLGTAYASASMGLSLAIGAFIAGLMISESPYSHQILADILPFRDIFNALFFISIGMLLDLSVVRQEWHNHLAFAIVVLFGKAIILFALLLLGRFPARISVITAFSLAQVGEFSFLLAEQSKSLGLLPENLYQLFLASAILTMFLTPFAIMIAVKTGHRLPTGEPKGTRIEPRKDHLLIVGFGLNGKNLSQVVREAGIPFLVIELDPERLREAEKDEIPVLFGDASRRKVLQHAQVAFARMVVIAISDQGATRRCVATVRALNQRARILVRTRYVAQVESLMQLGADIVIPEEFETSIEIFARVLQEYRIPDHLIDQQVSVIRSGSYGMLRGLSLSQERLMRISELFLKSTVQQIVIGTRSPARKKSLRDLEVRQKTGATILAVLREEQAITNPPADFVLEENDVVVLWGAHQQLADAEKTLTAAAS